MKKLLIYFGIFLFFNTIAITPCLAKDVYYNTKSHKYHSFNCKWAKKCTVNCIKISKKEAQKRGGVPCKVCGGN